MELSIGTPIVFTKKVKTLHVNLISTQAFMMVEANVVIVSTTSFNLDSNYLDYSTNTAMSLEDAQSLIIKMLADIAITK